jgi:hypothetical protein
MPLVTLAQVQLNGLPTIHGTGIETVVQDELIPEAEQVLAQWLCFPVADDGAFHLETTAYTSFLSGPRPTDRNELVLPVRPVVEVTAVYRSTERTYDATTLVDASEYEVDEVAGLVIAGWAQQGWTCGYRAQKVQFTAGFGDQGEAPKAIILAVAYQVQAILSGRRHGPVVDQVENGQVQSSPQLVAVDARAKSLLGQFRLWERSSEAA